MKINFFLINVLFIIILFVLLISKKEKFNNKIGINYDFIEIGTSNFDTEIQKANDNTIGLVVEPLKVYLDDLPNKKNCKKINKAISNKRDKSIIYYIKPEDINKYKLDWWLKGCNSINKPHPTVVDRLKRINRMDLLNKKLIDVITFEDLVKENNVNKIKLLKIDTEGHDTVILDNIISYCDKNKHTFPDKIIFETNKLSKKEEQEKVIFKLKDRNYRIIQRDTNTVLEKNK